jgi:dephospho-CoA kinase
VGITGGIACGKTTVSKILQELIRKRTEASIFFIDIDLIAHDILLPRAKGLETAYWKIVEAFSDYDIFEETQGSENNPSPRNIDRRKLGGIIFKDPSKRKILNGLTHPLISKIMMKEIIYTSIHLFRRNAPFVLVDIPLLFEAGLKMKLLFAIKIVVATPHYLQLNRLTKRNPELFVQQCEDRIASQMPVIKKVKMADIVVWNNQTISHLEKEVERALVETLNRKRGYLGLSMIHFILLGASMNIVYYWIKSLW